MQRTNSLARGIHVAPQSEQETGSIRNMMGGKCPLWVEKLVAARKLDEVDDMHEAITKLEKKQASKQGRLTLNAGKLPETPDRKSQSPKRAVQRTYSSGRGIHVARGWRGGTLRPRKNDGQHRWG